MLHNLLEYADSQGIRGEAGFASKRIRFLFQFSSQGDYLGSVYDYGKKGREFSNVPHLQFAGDVPKRQFLVDTIDFLALYPKEKIENGLCDAVHALTDAVPVLLADLEQEVDFDEIRLLSNQILMLFIEKKYLELREQDLKKKWITLLKKRGRGRRSEKIKSFCNAKGLVGKVFNNAEFKRIGKHQFCLRLLKQASTVEPLFGNIAKAMEDHTVLEKIHNDLSNITPAPISTNNATFAILGKDDRILVKEEFWHNWWKKKQAELSSNLSLSNARCFLSGKEIHPLLTHPKIKGLGGVGGNAETSLISFKDGRPSFQSYGFSQGENAAISIGLAAKYAASTNHLLNHQHQQLAGAEILYWYSGTIQKNEDIFNAAFKGLGEFEEDDDNNRDDSRLQEAQANMNAKKFLKSVIAGDRSDLKGARFYALTLQGNKGRAVVQNWIEGSFVDLATNIDQWFSDLEIPRITGRGIAKSPKIENVITCLLNERKLKQDYMDWVKPVTGLREAIWKAAVGGRAIPFPVNTARLALLRLRESMLTDEWENALDANGKDMGKRRARLYARIGIIKAFLIRNIKAEIDMEDRTKNKNSVYWLGCLFAVLADLQRSAHQSDGGANVKATIVDRFYTTASTCPKLVYGRLIAQSQHHLRKLENKKKNAAIAINNEIALLNQRIDFAQVSNMLSLSEQSWFALGYYQQMADMNCKKSEAYAAKQANSKKGDNK